MYTDSVYASSWLESTSSATSTTGTSSTSNELDSDAFMTLFLAQLQNQDPLNPMEDTDMLAELAQFSTLEQLATMNESLSTMADQLNAQLVNSAVSYIGMDVVAEGDTLSKGEDGVSATTYTLPEDAVAATASIFDEDGELVASFSLDELEAGQHDLVWDGLDLDGQEAADGNYTVSVSAWGSDGDLLSVSTTCEGTVVGMSSQNGSTVFELDDGRTVDFMSIISVHAPTEA